MSDIRTRAETKEYDAGIDAMTCRYPGCKKWKADGRQFCLEHSQTCYALVEEMTEIRYEKRNRP